LADSWASSSDRSKEIGSGSSIFVTDKESNWTGRTINTFSEPIDSQCIFDISQSKSLVIIESILKTDFIGTIYSSWIRARRSIRSFIYKHLVRESSLEEESSSVSIFNGNDEIQISR